MIWQALIVKYVTEVFAVVVPLAALLGIDSLVVDLPIIEKNLLAAIAAAWTVGPPLWKAIEKAINDVRAPYEVRPLSGHVDVEGLAGEVDGLIERIVNHERTVKHG